MSSQITYSVEYDELGPDSEVPAQSLSITGLSSFLALALTLDIPILSDDVSYERWERTTLGSGTSFLVTRSYMFRQHEHSGYLDPNATIDGKPGGLGDRFKSCKSLVSKRICRRTQSDDDHLCLAPMVKEMRILGHSTLKDHENIVRMLCVDWNGDRADLAGHRCWPSLLLECAHHGTLGQYLAPPRRPSWDTKWHIFLGIAEGLHFLHEHSVAHCDLKLDNILVSGELNNVVAKISDFGFSVITSDFDEDAAFLGIAGTNPWNAPELAFGLRPRVHDIHKADIYSMGLVFCAIALNGHTPWEGISANKFQELKGKGEDGSIFQLLRDSISEAIEQQGEYVEQILDVTVKTNPNDRHSGWGLVQLIVRASLSHIK